MHAQLQLHTILRNLFTYLNNAQTTKNSSAEPLWLEEVFKKWSKDQQNQVFELVTRAKDHARKISIVRGYPLSRPSTPTIAIALGGSNTSNQLIGGGQVEINQILRLFDTQLTVFLISDNQDEIVFLHEIVESFLVSAVGNLELLGFQNLRLSSQDLQTQTDIVPTPIYLRSVSLNFLRQKDLPVFARQVTSSVRQAIFSGEIVEEIL